MALISVGFGGRPVRAAAGIKPALVFDDETQRYATLDNIHAGSWWSEQEIARFATDGLLTTLKHREPSADGVVALYAHVNFVAPSSEPDEPRLVYLDTEPLWLEPEIACYVGLLPRPRAFGLLDAWAKALLDAADAKLGDRSVPYALRGRAAFRESQRSRFCSAGRSDARTSRERALVLAWAALLLQGQPTDDLHDDALLDFKDAALRALEAHGERRFREALKASPQRPAPAPRGYGDTADHRHRQLEDSSP